ncbi:leucyl aminopeptidase family protein [Hyphobacterium sp. HN65]|uniref:Leucyl aminopeptidase family protein n=1 Tax=Hyphobacterium lacteum TaxID=3116575 RepID=A0ABU7LPH0_9PROT|nr:leucyl aminopeptidase family protein [Hyphobacterium sp. HN65]MEE2525504.1 leucyl aminopeptidase family protein [Hyphobacterium sp. HN65]
MTDIFAAPSDKNRLILAVPASLAETLPETLTDTGRAVAKANSFGGDAGQIVLLPEGSGADALVGLGNATDPFALGDAAKVLPEGDWQLEGDLGEIDPTMAMVAFGAGAYQFTRYKKPARKPARLAPVDGADVEEATRVVRSIWLTRDLVNTPAGDMDPAALQKAVETVGKEFGAKVKATIGDDLVKERYGMIHAVGRAAHCPPRLIELEWGDPKHPRLAIVGKGITFDSGGLDIKPAAGMRLMKKDMGGSANALALARLIMDAKLPVRLHLLIAAAENAIDGNAFRPGDVLTSRLGLTVEIDNTDAEGRLVLGDALAKAVEDDAELILDFATLTGAARVALGPDLAPYYTDDQAFGDALAEGAAKVGDPVWRMPLWDGYDKQLEGTISDLKNTGDGGFAGSVTAALFLRRFTGGRRWCHFDIFAWNPKDRPGRPMGGEMLGSRAAWEALKVLYG